jgi:hypothetical protein
MAVGVRLGVDIEIVHGTTVASTTILQKKGARAPGS